MEIYEGLVQPISLVIAIVVLCCLLYLYWRHIWFFRNPPRSIPGEDTGILSPADGTVVYVKEVLPGENVITIKRGVSATLKDITKEDMFLPKLLIGIFMSPFNVHYNRTPISGRVGSIRHYPALTKNACMAAMHFRTVFRHLPLYRNSIHIVQNERTVTRLDGEYRGRPLSCYVVQIAAKSVSGIDSYVAEGERLEAGRIFGMIRIGSQVDLVLTPHQGMNVKVCPGTKVRAGETILAE